MSAPLSRIIVALCLVVALTLQPLALFAGVATCNDVDATPASCADCQCCVDKPAGAPCCCHPAEEKVPAESSSGDDATIAPTAALAVQANCRCGLKLPPLQREAARIAFERPAPTRVIGELACDRDLKFELAFARAEDSRWDHAPDPTFSQRIHCVWRL